MSSPPPSLPADYRVPDVWCVPPPSPTSPFGAVNRPTAGARYTAQLPVGEHALQLYSLGTPNGQKVTVLLEELGVEYDAWRVDIMAMQQFSSGFVSVNPNSKIPALVDRSQQPPVRVFESGSILWYLAEKYGRMIPQDASGRAECMNWLMWQMGTAPYLGGGFGHFYKYANVKIEYAIDRFAMETKRIVDVLDQHLADKQYVCGGDYTIADISIMPWIRCLDVGYNARKFLNLDQYINVNRWMDTLMSRDAVKRGMNCTYQKMDDVIREQANL